eukprot:1141336-Pelagomonas_calceolata.AAC.2
MKCLINCEVESDFTLDSGDAAEVFPLGHGMNPDARYLVPEPLWVEPEVACPGAGDTCPCKYPNVRAIPLMKDCDNVEASHRSDNVV